MNSAFRLLRELIALPSVNPAFLPDQGGLIGEHRVADYLAAIGAKAGLAVDFQKVFPRRSNVLLRLTPPGAVTQRILLAPHLDTVGGPGDLETLFTPRLRNGRLHGRGACDTKGCVASMLTALMTVAKKRRRPQHTEIVFAGLVDEECGQAGSRALASSGLPADLAIVGEPTRLKVVTAHKGDAWLRLDTVGKPAHGARPELGRNAVHAMAKVVHALETTYASRLKRRRHPLLGHGTVNVGTIRGGTQANIVPAGCRITVDRRTLPGETAATVRREILSLLRQQGLKARVTDMKGAPCEPLETDPQLPLVRAFMRSVGQRRTLGVDFFCDAAPLAAGGIPGIVFGPGDIAQAHTADEWIALESLERGTRLLTRFLESLP
jgi:succinyl-diaminopimelate desuccinylase